MKRAGRIGEASCALEEMINRCKPKRERDRFSRVERSVNKRCMLHLREAGYLMVRQGQGMNLEELVEKSLSGNDEDG